MENNTEQAGTKIIINALHVDAMMLRYEGKTYKEMNRILFERHGKYILEGRLRKWFAKGGILHELYKQYSKEETEEKRELMHQQLRKLGMEIPSVLKDTLFMPMRNPFTGEEIKNADGSPVYQRNKVTNEAVKLLAQLLGAKFTDDESSKVGDVLESYFERIEQIPSAKPAEIPAPAAVEKSHEPAA